MPPSRGQHTRTTLKQFFDFDDAPIDDLAARRIVLEV